MIHWNCILKLCWLYIILSESNGGVNNGQLFHRQKADVSFSDLGPLKDNERRDLNCAVKEYLLIAGYRLTAMTFFEEVLIEMTLVYVIHFCLISFSSEIDYNLRWLMYINNVEQS